MNPMNDGEFSKTCGFLFLWVLNSCLASDRLNNLKFDKRITGSVFLTVYGEDLMKCQDNCANRLKCKSINYHRGSRHCELSSIVAADDAALPDDSGWIYQAHPDWETETSCGACTESQVCDTVSRTCTVRECDPYTTSDTLRVLGNMNSVGARVVLACPVGMYPASPADVSDWPIRTVCQGTGTWSAAGLTCSNYTENCQEYLMSTTPTHWSRVQYIDVPLISGPCGVDDDKLTASSVHDLNTQFQASNAKFSVTSLCWVAAVPGLDPGPHPYIQVTLPTILEVKQVQTKGRPVIPQYITSYNIQYSDTEDCPDGSYRHAFTETGSQVFDGNEDATNVKTNTFNPFIRALCVRLYVLSQGDGYAHPSTKFELIGTIQLPVI